MLTPDLVEPLTRLCTGVHGPMLMLGAQESKIPGTSSREWFSRFVGDEYEELDLDGGDLKFDLNDDLTDLAGRYGSVFSFGTVEHCWDIHQAWVNVARAVALDGHYLHHGPAGGWLDGKGEYDHGVHLTVAPYIDQFLKLNGFKIEDRWMTRWRDRGLILWMRARRVTEVTHYRKPLQVHGAVPK